MKDAGEAHAAAASAAEEARAAIVTGRDLYAATGRLDSEMLNRHGKISEAVRKETRQGIGWYEATHTGRAPLKNVSIPHGKTRLVLPLDAVAGALAAAVGEEGSFPAGDWLPPTDSEHDAMLAAPLDTGTAWVRSAVLRLHGPKCAVCGGPGADVVAEVAEQGAPLVMVHAKCRDRKPDEKENRRAERLAKMQAHGFPPPPHWTGDGDE